MGLAYGFPRGEAVERSETDEDRRYLKISGAARDKALYPDMICPVFVQMLSQLSPFLFRPSVRTGAPSPRGKARGATAPVLQTPIYPFTAESDKGKKK